MSDDRYGRRRYKVSIRGSSAAVWWSDHDEAKASLEAMAKALPMMQRNEMWTIERIEDEQADAT